MAAMSAYVYNGNGQLEGRHRLYMLMFSIVWLGVCQSTLKGVTDIEVISTGMQALLATDARTCCVLPHLSGNATSQR